jgi:natural product precursor
MKKKVVTKKLVLTKETIAALNNNEMDAILGGTKVTELLHTCYTLGCGCATTGKKNNGDSTDICL